MIEELENKEIREKILGLRTRHRELDQRIAKMEVNPYRNQLEIRRLKKEKLYIKDCIERLSDKLIPDLNA